MIRTMANDNVRAIIDEIHTFKRAAEKFGNQDYATGYLSALSALEGFIAGLPAVDAAPVVRCKECIYWMDRHVLLNDGTRRPFNPGEDDVACDVGINCGSRCMFDADYMDGNGPFRQKGDFCSRGVKKEDDEK